MQLRHTFFSDRGRDAAESGDAEGAVGLGEGWGIGDIEEFGAELELGAFAEGLRLISEASQSRKAGPRTGLREASPRVNSGAVAKAAVLKKRVVLRPPVGRRSGPGWGGRRRAARR